jgi:hypothetical protein
MVELGFSQSFELAAGLVERCVVNCLAARPRECQVAEVYALDMPYLPATRQEERPRGLGTHDVDILEGVVLSEPKGLVRVLETRRVQPCGASRHLRRTKYPR